MPGVQAIVRGWLDRITSPASALLTAVSVLAQAASFDHLCQVAGLDEMQAIEALDELLGKQLLLVADELSPTVTHDPIYSFSHQKVSEVVYAEAGIARQRLLHQRAFEVLKERAIPSAELAHHAVNAGLLTETIHYSLVAGNEAMDIFAFPVAITHWGETECARMLADTLLELGHYGQAIILGRQASQQARIVDVLGVTRFAILTWGSVQRTVMAFESAQKTLLEGLGIGVPQGLIGWADWAQAELCAVHSLAGDWEQAYNHAQQTLKACEDQSFLPRGLSYWYVIEALLRGGDEDLARAEVERLSKLVGNNKRFHLILLRSQAVLAQWDGDLDQAISHLQAALALAQEIGLPGEEWPILGELGRLYAARGEEGQAQQAYQEAGTIIYRLAETIDEDDLRVGFITAVPGQSILALSKGA